MISSATILNLVERLIHSKKLWVIFFLFSFVIYFSFFIKGLVIVSTTDSIFSHYPNLFFGLEHLQEGRIPLWNPYFFGGIDFTTSMHHHILNPANWILALFPKEYALYVLTFIEFMEIAFIGVFSFKTFQCLHNSRIISFASAIVVQLSGFTWFTTTTFIGVEFFFLSIVFIYLIISFENRRPIVNFILMALLSAGMFWEGHVGYIAAFFFPVILVQIIRHRRKLWKIRGNPNLIFACASLFGLGMALFRIYPILTASVEDVISLLPGSAFTSNGYKLLSGVIPAVFGIDLHICNAFFQQLKIDGHIQFHCLLYFGLPTVMFFLLSLSGRFSKAISVWSWLTVFLIFGSVVAFLPAVDLIYFISYPFVHGIVLRVGLAFLIFALFYFSVRKFHEKQLQFFEKDLRIFLVFLGITLCFFATFFSHFSLYNENLSGFHSCLIRLIIACLFIFTVWSGLKFSTKLNAIKLFNNWILSIFIIALFCTAGFYTCYYNYVKAIGVYHIGVLIWSLSLLLLVRRERPNRVCSVLLGIFVLCILYIEVLQNIKENKPPNSVEEVIYFFPLMGGLTFIVAFLALWEIFAHLHHGKINHRVFLLVMTLFLVGDLIFYSKIYSYSGAPPFLDKDKLYPEILSDRVDRFSPVLENNMDESCWISQDENRQSCIPDFKNYRVNHPGNYFLYPWFNAFSSAFMNYHVRTIGGIDSTIQKSFLDYLGKFVQMGPSFYNRGMIFPGISNLRVEELYGIRYTFSSTQELRINENTVSRFSAFSNFFVVSSNDELINLLSREDFRVNETVVLNQLPDGLQPEPSVKAEKLEYEPVGTDKIILNLDQEKARIILFNDTFHEEWRATWNGEAIPILVANGRFMAVCVPAGFGILEFNFHPHMFFQLVKVSLILGAFLLALGIYALLTKKKKQC